MHIGLASGCTWQQIHKAHGRLQCDTVVWRTGIRAFSRRYSQCQLYLYQTNRKLRSIDEFCDSLNSSRCGWHTDNSLEKIGRNYRILPSLVYAEFSSNFIELFKRARLLLRSCVNLRYPFMYPQSNTSCWHSRNYCYWRFSGNKIRPLAYFRCTRVADVSSVCTFLRTFH